VEAATSITAAPHDTLGQGTRFPMIRYLPDVVLSEGVKYRELLALEAWPTDRDSAQQELRRITGSWALVYWLFDGEEQSLAGGRPVMTFEAEKFTIRVGGRVIEKGLIERLDPHQHPKPFVYAPTEVNGEARALKYPGIYLLEDDLFIACIGYKGERPRAFSSGAGSMTELVVYTRLKD
jgi:uncharacterized protein (TIGR03067 family)